MNFYVCAGWEKWASGWEAKVKSRKGEAGAASQSH